MGKKLILKVNSKSKGQRLDKFLVKSLPDFSRSYFQKLIQDKQILVNKKSLKSGYKLKVGDQIEITIPRAEKIKLKPEPIPLKIVYEDKDILVINKQAGLSVHPATGCKKGTLCNAILAYLPDLERIGDKIRPGIVHRLDKDTSGLMVVAKNDKTHRFLVNQFAQRKVKKKYLALVYGIIKTKHFQIKNFIARSKRDPRKMAIVLLGKGRLAITNFKLIKVYQKKFSLVEVEPKTGRTHQIRVHLNYLGHPVVGDKLYTFKNLVFPYPITRQFLHAYFLSFELPSGEIKEFKIDLPSDLKQIIKKLEKNYDHYH